MNPIDLASLTAELAQAIADTVRDSGQDVRLTVAMGLNDHLLVTVNGPGAIAFLEAMNGSWGAWVPHTPGRKQRAIRAAAFNVIWTAYELEA